MSTGERKDSSRARETDNDDETASVLRVMRGASAIPLPPLRYRELVCGPSNAQLFETVGQRLVSMLESEGMIASDVDLLDVGCGCGRVARYLVSSPLRSYVGFDRHEGMVDWCEAEITSRDARFSFQHFDLMSAYREYDEHVGRIRADEFVFPYDDSSFDSALLASVFTHMPLNEIEHYLRELQRVLRRGGRILLSVFHSDRDFYTESINFFHRPQDFLEAVAEAKLTPRAREGQVQFGYKHNWYRLTHPA